MIAELELLISLQETDTEIKRCNAEIVAFPTRREEIEQTFAKSVSDFLEIKSALDTATAERKDLEEDIAVEQAKLDKFKLDLTKVTTGKQYEIAIREIDATSKTISSLETEVLKLMEKIDKLDAQVKERSPEIEARRNEVDKQLADIAASVAAAETRLTASKAERQGLISKLTPQTRATYERVARLKSGLALSEANNYSCTACRIAIRPQAFNDIKRGERIFECENCGRILFYRADAAAS